MIMIILNANTKTIISCNNGIREKAIKYTGAAGVAMPAEEEGIRFLRLTLFEKYKTCSLSRHLPMNVF